MRPFPLFIFGPAWIFFSTLMLVAMGPGDAWWSRPVFIVLFGGWSVFLAYLMVWSTFGRERITASADSLTAERILFGHALSSRKYEPARISRLRYELIRAPGFTLETALHWSPAVRWGFHVGPVVFDYDSRTVRLAEGLRDRPHEAIALVSDLSDALGVDFDHEHLEQAPQPDAPETGAQ